MKTYHDSVKEAEKEARTFLGPGVKRGIDFEIVWVIKGKKCYWQALDSQAASASVDKLLGVKK